APCGPPRRRPRPGRRSRAGGSTRSASPPRQRCATWSVSPASRMPVPWWRASARRPRPPPGSSACGWTWSPTWRRGRRWSMPWPRTLTSSGTAGRPCRRPASPSPRAVPPAEESPPMSAFPSSRPRRLRRNAALRRLATQVRLHPADLLLPMFVREDAAEPVPVRSMPGVVQHTLESLRKAAVEAGEAGVGGLGLFRGLALCGVPAGKDAVGSGGIDPDGILNVALRALREELGDAAVLVSDLCLDEFTDHGHCGVLRLDGSVDNDATLAVYAEMALAQA